MSLKIQQTRLCSSHPSSATFPFFCIVVKRTYVLVGRFIIKTEICFLSLLNLCAKKKRKGPILLFSLLRNGGVKLIREDLGVSIKNIGVE